jgi:glycosyltransferase involved in cell wall biosynthesis
MKDIIQNDISVVIPVLDFPQTLPKILNAIDNQIYKPREIIIVCSGNHQNLKDFLIKNKFKIPINVKYVLKAFPGEARNIGVSLVKNPWVAFLDSKTLPDKDWLKAYFEYCSQNNLDGMLGRTRFIANSNFQLTYKYCSFGNIIYDTVPGTLFKTTLIKNKVPFSKKYRYGEDRLWRNVIRKSSLKFFSPNEKYIDYIDLPSNSLETIKKYYFSSLYAYYESESKLEIYMSLFLIIYVTILPQWNNIIDGWTTNPLFIPHISKIITATILVFYVLHMIYSKKVYLNQISIFSYLLKHITIISILFIALNWNDVFANWSEESLLYFPHITKLYILALIFFSMINRGIIIPIKKKVNYKKLFPFKWIRVGLLGVLLDSAKFFGLLCRLFLKLKTLKTNR